MLDGFKNLLGSEKAIAAGVLVIASTVLVAMGQMSVDEWSAYTKWVLAIYVGGKTIQGATALIAGARVEVAAHEVTMAEHESVAGKALFNELKPILERYLPSVAPTEPASVHTSGTIDATPGGP